MGLIVDTTVWIEVERRSNRLTGSELGAFLLRTGESDFGISVLTLSELAYGHALNAHITPGAASKAISDLSTIFPVHTVTTEVAVRAGALNAHLRRNGTPIGLADVLIAATALELGFGVLTHNTRHFSYVPELRVLDAANV